MSAQLNQAAFVANYFDLIKLLFSVTKAKCQYEAKNISDLKNLGSYIDF